MPLSDKETKKLIEQAEACMNSWEKASNNVNIKYVEEACACLNQLIENGPPHSYYFSQRARVLFILSSWTNRNLIDQTITDIDKAIELDPDQADNYHARASYLFRKVDSAIGDERKQFLEKIISSCKISLEKDPTKPIGWFLLMSADILSCDWEDVISYYGSSKPYITKSSDQLIRAWLGCLALALAGDSIEEEDKKPLYDKSIYSGCGEFMVVMASFLGESYLLETRKQGGAERWRKAIEIQKLFTGHFPRWFDKGVIFQRVRCYDDALNAFNKELELNPDFTQAQERKEDVLEWLRLKNVGIEEEYYLTSLWYRKGRNIYDNSHHYEEALQIFDKILEIDPKHPGALEYKRRCLEVIGDLEVASGHFKIAINVYGRIMELEPNNEFIKNRKKCLVEWFNMSEEGIVAFKVAWEKFDELGIQLQGVVYIIHDGTIFNFIKCTLMKAEGKGILARGFIDGVLKIIFIPFSVLVEFNNCKINLITSVVIKNDLFKEEEPFMDVPANMFKEINRIQVENYRIKSLKVRNR